MRPGLRALRYIGPHWPMALGALLAMLLVSVANLATPQLIRFAIDGGIIPGNLSAALIATAGLLGVALARGIFSFVQGYLAEKVSQNAAYDMRNAIYGKLQTLSFSFHDRSQTGQLMTRVTSDVDMVRMFAGQGLLQFVGALFMFAGAAGILIAMNLRLALIALATLPVIFVCFGFVVKKAHPLFAGVQARLGTLNTILQENLAGARVVKAFVREEHEAGRYNRANEDLLAHNMKTVRIFRTAFPLTVFISSLGTAAVLWYGGHLVVGGEITLGALVAFNTYLGLLVQPAFMVGMLSMMVSRASASAKRIFEVVDAESVILERPDAVELPNPVAGRVAFEAVSFRYLASDRNVLEEASFVVQPGQTVAIVGTTGSGKSTIINLIPRFYDVTAGRVTVDGHDVRDVSLNSLRGQIGIVLQDTLLFSGTIRENIAYGAPDAPLDEIVRAARLAHAHEFIVEQPDGYNTKIGEAGVGLSGGQMQRIAIARALLLSPRILILDDSTSAVDAETEYQIQRSLSGLLGDRTTFIIAQRISTVRGADLIFVLDAARIVAIGTHAGLLESCPLYGEIVASQLQDDVPALAEETEA